MQREKGKKEDSVTILIVCGHSVDMGENSWKRGEHCAGMVETPIMVVWWA